MANELTSADACMARYFIEDKGDVTRWCDWEAKRALLIEAVPEIEDWMRTQRVADVLRYAAIEKLREIVYR